MLMKGARQMTIFKERSTIYVKSNQIDVKQSNSLETKEKKNPDSFYCLSDFCCLQILENIFSWNEIVLSVELFLKNKVGS